MYRKVGSSSYVLSGISLLFNIDVLKRPGLRFRQCFVMLTVFFGGIL